MRHHTVEHVYNTYMTISNYQFGILQQNWWNEWAFTFSRTGKGVQVMGSLASLRELKAALGSDAEIQNVA